MNRIRMSGVLVVLLFIAAGAGFISYCETGSGHGGHAGASPVIMESLIACGAGINAQDSRHDFHVIESFPSTGESVVVQLPIITRLTEETSFRSHYVGKMNETYQGVKSNNERVPDSASMGDLGGAGIALKWMRFHFRT